MTAALSSGFDLRIQRYPGQVPMCFSVEASFTAAAALLPVGVYCTHLADQKNRAYLPLAMIPVVFAVQQMGEGMVWFGLDHDNPTITRHAALVFLFFALLFWLFWVPFSLLLIEPRRPVKCLLAALCPTGLAIGAALYFPMALQPETRLDVTVAHHSIRYHCGTLPHFNTIPGILAEVLYVVVVFLPLLASSSRQLRSFTISLAIAAVAAYLVFWYAFISVWCFFAAALSVQLLVVLRKLPEAEKHQPFAIS